MIESGHTREARRAARRPTAAASTLRTDGGEPVDVIVLDISRSGLRILSDAELGVGQEISIGLAGAGSTRAYIAWARGNEYGCAFERPIAPEDEALAFSRAPVKRLGRTLPDRGDSADDYLRELYRKHRIWALPWDAVVAMAALVAIAWVFLRR